MFHLKRLAILAAGLALIGAVVGADYVLHLGPWRSEDRGPVVARVDGRPIFLSEARARLQGLSSVHGEIEQALGKEWQEKVLQSLVDDVIIREEADRRGIHLTDQEVAAAVDQIRQDLPQPGAFESWLDEQGMDLAELERRVTLNLLAARVYMAVTAPVTVSGQEIRAYYRSHRADYEEVDGTIPSLLEVRGSIRQDLEKREKDRAFAAWLDGRRQAVNVVVVLDDWWRSI